jgi:PAS domain S-box-containing protein
MNEFRVGDLDRRGSEELLKSFFADAAVGLSITDLQGRFVQVNPAYCSLTGYTEAELEARDFQSLTHPDDLPRTMAKVQSLLSGEISSFLIEKRYIRKDAIVVCVLNSVSVIRDNAGRPTNLVRLSQDITERVGLEESLRQAEARTESILESIADVHVLFDRNWRYVYVNEAAVRAIGRPREQILGRTLWELFPDIVGTELEREYRRAMDERVNVNFDFHHQTRNNWWENRIYPVPIGLALFATDITERKHTEEELRRAKEFSERLIQTANVIVLGLDMKGKINIFNQTAEKITGYAFSELEGKSWFETLVPKDKYPHVWEEFSRLVASDKVPSTFENPILTKNGEERYIAWRNNQVRMDGKVVGIISFGNDITEHKQAEERLREYEKVVEGLEEMIVVVDRDYRYLLANQAFLKQRQMEREQVVGHLVSEILDSQLFEKVIKPQLDRCFQGKVVRYEMNYSYPEIGERVLAISCFPIEGPHGVDQAACVLQDITERRRAGAALREAEQKYRDIFENAGEGIFQSTREGRYIAANLALARMHGFDSPEELIRDRSDISTQIYVDPERREEFKRLLEEQGAVRGFEHQVFRKDGSKIWISVNARAVRDGQGRILYYEGTSQDISERREAEAALRKSEERYRELFENAKDAIYVHDLGGRYRSFNRAAEQLSGYTRDEIIGKHFSNFVSPRSLKDVRENLCKKLDEMGETTYEIDLVRKDRSRVPVEVSSRLIYENGKPVGIQGVARDISDRRRAQDALRTYSQRLIEAQEAERQNIARELHDEIGQVLTAVRMNLQSLQRSAQSGSQPSAVDDSLVIVDEALERVRELSLNLRPSVLDSLGLSSALRWYVDRYARRSGIVADLRSNLEDGRRLRVELETACFRIVQEALTNVVRHARATHVLVRLRRSNGNLDLKIRDNGVGFNVETLLKDSPSAGALGLRGMEERAVAVHGRLKIDSAPMRGTEVRASFPL